MSKKTIGIGLIVVAGLLISYFASGVIDKENPPEKKRVSQLYRGIDARRYSKSLTDLQQLLSQ